MEKASFDCPIISPAYVASDWAPAAESNVCADHSARSINPQDFQQWVTSTGSNAFFQELTGMLYVVVVVFFNRNVKKSSGNLRLIDSELEITVEASTTERFPVKIRPSKAKVIDLMAEIEQKLGIPVKDQKVYHGMARISDAPRRGLPPKLTKRN